MLIQLQPLYYGLSEKVNRMTWNERLRKLRNGVSIRAIARRAGVGYTTVLNLEQGRGTMESLVRVMEQGLGLNVAQVFLE